MRLFTQATFKTKGGVKNLLGGSPTQFGENKSVKRGGGHNDPPLPDHV